MQTWEKTPILQRQAGPVRSQHFLYINLSHSAELSFLFPDYPTSLVLFFHSKMCFSSAKSANVGSIPLKVSAILDFTTVNVIEFYTFKA